MCVGPRVVRVRLPHVVGDMAKRASWYRTDRLFVPIAEHCHEWAALCVPAFDIPECLLGSGFALPDPVSAQRQDHTMTSRVVIYTKPC